MRKLAVSAATVTTLALGIGLGTAQATRTVKIASKISIKAKALTFSGNVTASNPACEASRKVTLYTTGGHNLGSTKTNSAGHWKITPSGYAGISLAHFYARVKQRMDGTAGTIYVCQAAKSKTIAL